MKRNGDAPWRWGGYSDKSFRMGFQLLSIFCPAITQCKSSGGLKYKGAMARYIDEAEARIISWCALERTLLFINFLLCALTFQHICVNN